MINIPGCSRDNEYSSSSSKEFNNHWWHSGLRTSNPSYRFEVGNVCFFQTASGTTDSTQPRSPYVSKTVCHLHKQESHQRGPYCLSDYQSCVHSQSPPSGFNFTKFPAAAQTKLTEWKRSQTNLSGNIITLHNWLLLGTYQKIWNSSPKFTETHVVLSGLQQPAQIKLPPNPKGLKAILMTRLLKSSKYFHGSPAWSAIPNPTTPCV